MTKGGIICPDIPSSKRRWTGSGACTRPLTAPARGIGAVNRLMATADKSRPSITRNAVTRNITTVMNIIMRNTAMRNITTSPRVRRSPYRACSISS